MRTFSSPLPYIARDGGSGHGLQLVPFRERLNFLTRYVGHGFGSLSVWDAVGSAPATFSGRQSHTKLG